MAAGGRKQPNYKFGWTTGELRQRRGWAAGLQIRLTEQQIANLLKRRPSSPASRQQIANLGHLDIW